MNTEEIYQRLGDITRIETVDGQANAIKEFTKDFINSILPEPDKGPEDEWSEGYTAGVAETVGFIKSEAEHKLR